MKWDIKMSVKENYKNSKLGLIPVDWEVVRLGDVAHIIGGYAFKSKLMSSEKSNFQILKMSNVYKGNLSLHRSPSYISDITPKELEYLLQENDIVLTLTGTIGKRDYGYATLIKGTQQLLLNQRLCKVKPEIGIENLFLYYLLKSENFLFNFYLSGKGGTGNQSNVGINDLKKIFSPLPPLKEQQEIAKILSTWDEAIETTQSLIEKLQFRKKGLMQELLSGKKRLAGFSEEWEENNLGDYFTERKETGLEDLELLSVGKEGVYPQDNSNKKDTSNSNKSKYKRICKGDIGYNTMRMWQGRSALSNLEGIVSPAYTILNPKENCDSVFFSHLFKLDDMIHKFYRNSQGMVSDTWMCKFKDLKIIKFNAPSSLSEQKAISKIIDLSDIEISEKKAYLLQLKNQKKGLMQQLLTGKKRVKL
ncbi:putative Type-1 restriction enzyme MjaXIP specificity protein [Tenacibaculum dicentrarchi]|nr:putative Type-1 restriction enzyme MjaXIP specificity protein [Tenacibaculum dicentrarchi]